MTERCIVKKFLDFPFLQKVEKSLSRQGDQIGRIFACWAIVYILWAGF
jgi:hypothetical protein